jgi:hypothetical protein
VARSASLSRVIRSVRFTFFDMTTTARHGRAGLENVSGTENGFANRLSKNSEKVRCCERRSRKKQIFPKIFLLPKFATQSLRNVFFGRCDHLLEFKIIAMRIVWR